MNGQSSPKFEMIGPYSTQVSGQDEDVIKFIYCYMLFHFSSSRSYLIAMRYYYDR